MFSNITVLKMSVEERFLNSKRGCLRCSLDGKLEVRNKELQDTLNYQSFFFTQSSLRQGVKQFSTGKEKFLRNKSTNQESPHCRCVCQVTSVIINIIQQVSFLLTVRNQYCIYKHKIQNVNITVRLKRLPYRE